jgi:S-formylglutathione hydrolase FrmB
MAFLQCSFHSDALRLACAMNVILPQPAGASQIGLTSAADDDHAPPVLYLLHGLSDDHTIWMRRTSIERYAAPLGLAVIMPAVNRSFYTDMAVGPKYWTFISEELPALCQRMFRLSPRREDTFVAGLSMGGYGAFKLALRRPERFAAAASLSGALDMTYRMEQTDDPEWNRELAHIFGDPSALQGSDNDTMHLAEQLAQHGGPKPRLFQCCGTEDFLIEHNRRFHEHATKLGLDLTYHEHEGDSHQWGYWDRTIQDVLAWLPLAHRPA